MSIRPYCYGKLDHFKGFWIIYRHLVYQDVNLILNPYSLRIIGRHLLNNY